MQPNRKHRPRILFLALIGIVAAAYGIATLESQERQQRYDAETAKMAAKMAKVCQEAGGRARAIKEVGDGQN